MTAPRLLGTWPAASPEWHAARRGRLGGSEIAAVMGLSPWESPFSLWHRKAALVGEQPENPQMSWGKRLEPAIAEAYAEMHPEYAVLDCGTYTHPSRPWQLGNPDRLLYGGGDAPGAVVLDERGRAPWPPDAVLEAKTARDDTGWGEPGTEEIPVYYRAQVLWYLDTLGLDTAHVAVLIAGSDYREYTVTRSGAREELAAMQSAATGFLASLPTADTPGVRPDIDGSTATYQVVKQLPEGMDDVDVELDPKTADAYADAIAVARDADAEKRRMVSLVLDHIGTGRRATCLGERVATRTVHPDGTTRSLMPARK